MFYISIALLLTLLVGFALGWYGYQYGAATREPLSHDHQAEVLAAVHDRNEALLVRLRVAETQHAEAVSRVAELQAQVNALSATNQRLWDQHTALAVDITKPDEISDRRQGGRSLDYGKAGKTWQ